MVKVLKKVSKQDINSPTVHHQPNPEPTLTEELSKQIKVVKKKETKQPLHSVTKPKLLFGLSHKQIHQHLSRRPPISNVISDMLLKPPERLAPQLKHADELPLFDPNLPPKTIKGGHHQRNKTVCSTPKASLGLIQASTPLHDSKKPLRVFSSAERHSSPSPKPQIAK